MANMILVTDDVEAQQGGFSGFQYEEELLVTTYGYQALVRKRKIELVNCALLDAIYSKINIGKL